MKLPLVSIIIPSYNSSAFISETLDSIKAQHYANIEIIVINDGSTDESPAIIRNRKEEIQLVTIQNGGVSNARNTGLHLASGDYILFLDADDILKPEYLSERIKILEHENFDVLSGKAIDYVDGIQKTCRKSYLENFDKQIALYNPELNTCPSGYLINLKKLKSHKLTFNTELSCSADRYFLLKLYDKGFTFKFVESEKSAFLYRIHASSMSNRNSEKLAKDLFNYFQIIKKEDIIKDRSIKKQLISKNYLILSGTYYNLNKINLAIKFSLKALFTSPRTVINYFLGKLK